MPSIVPDKNITVSFFISNGFQDRVKLNSILPSKLVKDILGILIPMSLHCEDFMVWPFHSSGMATVKSAYSFLPPYSPVSTFWVLKSLHDYCPQWQSVWNLNCAPKIRYFIWSPLKYKLLMRDNLSQKLRSIPLKCPYCENYLEFVRYLFFDCVKVSFIWQYMKDRYTLYLPVQEVNISWFCKALNLNWTMLDLDWKFFSHTCYGFYGKAKMILFSKELVLTLSEF